MGSLFRRRIGAADLLVGGRGKIRKIKNFQLSQYLQFWLFLIFSTSFIEFPLFFFEKGVEVGRNSLRKNVISIDFAILRDFHYLIWNWLGIGSMGMFAGCCGGDQHQQQR